MPVVEEEEAERDVPLEVAQPLLIVVQFSRIDLHAQLVRILIRTSGFRTASPYFCVSRLRSGRQKSASSYRTCCTLRSAIGTPKKFRYMYSNK